MKNALILVTYILFLIPLTVSAEETEKSKNTCSQMRIFSGGIDDSSLYLLSNTVIDPCLKKGFKTSLTISSGGGDVSPDGISRKRKSLFRAVCEALSLQIRFSR